MATRTPERTRARPPEPRWPDGRLFRTDFTIETETEAALALAVEQLAWQVHDLELQVELLGGQSLEAVPPRDLPAHLLPIRLGQMVRAGGRLAFGDRGDTSARSILRSALRGHGAAVDDSYRAEES